MCVYFFVQSSRERLKVIADIDVKFAFISFYNRAFTRVSFLRSLAIVNFPRQRSLEFSVTLLVVDRLAFFLIRSPQARDPIRDPVASRRTRYHLRFAHLSQRLNCVFQIDREIRDRSLRQNSTSLRNYNDINLFAMLSAL